MTPAHRRKIAEAAKKRWADPAFRERMREKIKVGTMGYFVELRERQFEAMTLEELEKELADIRDAFVNQKDKTARLKPDERKANHEILVMLEKKIRWKRNHPPASSPLNP